MAAWFWFLAAISAMLASIAAYLTHIVMTIAAGHYVLLVIGLLFPPIGLIHGIMLWCGVGFAP